MISVVVPAFNEQRHLPRCLESLSSQTYKDFEVIVVVNGGTEDLGKTVRKFGARIIVQGKRGVGCARQAGFMAAKAEIIASTDADTVVPADWLERIQGLFDRNPDTIAVAGHFLLADGPWFVRQNVKLSLRLMPHILKLAPGLWHFSGTNFAVRASAFRQVGGFDGRVEFGEDIDLCRRLRKLGRLVFEPGMVVKTSGRAFSRDRLGLNHLVNYLSLLAIGRPVLPVVLGALDEKPDSRS